MTSDERFAWLPDHQLHVAATLGHVDRIVSQIGELLREYVRGDSLGLEPVKVGTMSHLTVTSVAPLPLAISRLTADATTQMRAALEHCVFSEVEYALGRKLNAAEETRVEMPVFDDESKFERWPFERRRPEIAPLAADGPLVHRIRSLQPFQSAHRSDEHPLRLLAAHSNRAKHRTPAVAATNLGRVIPERLVYGLEIPEPSVGPIRTGDVLVRSPVGVSVGADIWPFVSIERPHTGTWHVLMKELELIEKWVRTIALPSLIAGRLDVPELPAPLDIQRGHANVRAELEATFGRTAADRTGRALGAEGTIRPALIDLLQARASSAEIEAIRWWVSRLDDDAAIARMERLSLVGGLPSRAEEAVDQLVRIALRAYESR